MAQNTSTKGPFKGSCHCGKIRYEVDLHLPESPEQPNASRCNCTVCLKSGFTSLHISPKDFKLITPKEDLSDYQFRSKECHRYFCNKCGIQTHIEGSMELAGTRRDYFSINALTLDQPQEGLDLTTFKMSYWDGRNNNWLAGKKDTQWPGGCV